MAWKRCDMCSQAFGECFLATEVLAELGSRGNATCDNCLRWRRMMYRRLRCELDFFDGVCHFVYAWVELAHEPNPKQSDRGYINEYVRLRDEGVIFYIGRGVRKRLTDTRDRNPTAVDRRYHLSEYRSFGFQLLGGGDIAKMTELEEYSIKLFSPSHNLQWWNQ